MEISETFYFADVGESSRAAREGEAQMAVLKPWESGSAKEELLGWFTHWGPGVAAAGWKPPVIPMGSVSQPKAIKDPNRKPENKGDMWFVGPQSLTQDGAEI